MDDLLCDEVRNWVCGGGSGVRCRRCLVGRNDCDLVVVLCVFWGGRVCGVCVFFLIVSFVCGHMCVWLRYVSLCVCMFLFVCASCVYVFIVCV